MSHPQVSLDFNQPTTPLEELPAELVERCKPTSIIKDVSINLMDYTSDEPFYVVDSVRRSVGVGVIRNVPDTPPIPIIATHIVSGAGYVDKSSVPSLQLVLMRDILCVFLPLTAIEHSCYDAGYQVRFVLNPERTLDEQGDFYTKSAQLSLRHEVPLFIVDSSRRFQPRSRLRLRLDPTELVSSNNVFLTARDVAGVIESAMELGLIHQLLQRSRDEIIIRDGPLANGPFLRRARLATSSLNNLLSNERAKFDFLRRLIGVVKRVRIIPDRPLRGVFDIVGDALGVIFNNQDVGWHFIATFFVLRPELLAQMPMLPSPASALIRVDIPLPFLMDQYVSGWEDYQYVSGINLHSYIPKIKQAAGLIFSNRYPPPSSSPGKVLSELMPIFELENNLKANLLTPEQIAQSVRSELPAIISIC